ncbi:hypothetical protein [Streptomyces anulatus]|uniref:hypothetical protein n=1 Tax=Streptomyces anulatus TaxID=1892 RepID=UPI002E81F2A2|nr:hypothetical protein [Streptomyces anulatus]WUC91846.1 hypothetical protein OHQ35_37525 [Streptomyces anulatus]
MTIHRRGNTTGESCIHCDHAFTIRLSTVKSRRERKAPKVFPGPGKLTLRFVRHDKSPPQFSDGLVEFYRAAFSGGTVLFGESGMTGLARFSGGTVWFSNAVFSGGRVDFSGTEVSGGEVDFRSAAFSSGEVDFGLARFSGGTVDFSDAAFSGGTMDFSSATGPVPTGLLAALGTPATGRVILSSAWVPPAS